jgi:hypothetical protein
MKIWLKNTFQQAAWAPLTVFFVAAIAAKGFGVYILYPWLDMPTHFCGGMAITYFFLVAIAHAQARIGNIPKLIQLVASLGLTALTAVVWEFLEYLSDITWGTKMNLGVEDTLLDLFFGLLGGVALLVANGLAARIASVAPEGNTNV